MKMDSSSFSDDNDDASGVLKIANARKNAMRRMMSVNIHRETDEYRDSCNKLHEEVNELKDQLAYKNLEIRELNYEIKRLKKTEAEWNEKLQTNELRHKAALSSTQKSLDGLERKIVGNNQMISTECDRLLQLCNALDSHTMHGHHTVPSHTFISLLSNIRQGISNLKSVDSDVVFLKSVGAQGVGGNGIAIGSSTVDSSGVSSAQLSSGAAKDNTGGSLSTAATALGSVENTLLEMCRHLEEENKRLNEYVSTHNSELERLRKENSNVALIPHYRLAILRERTNATRLQESLDASVAQVCTLREQLEVSYRDIEKLSKDYQRSQLTIKQLQQEKTALYTDLEPILSSSSSVVGSSSHPRPRTGSQPGVGSVGDSGDGGLNEDVLAAPSIISTGPISSSGGTPAVPARTAARTKNQSSVVDQVREEIHVLDDDIVVLKHKLENAAKKQTQQIVADLLTSKYSV